MGWEISCKPYQPNSRSTGSGGDSVQYASYYLINTEAVPLSDTLQVTATREKGRGFIFVC